MEGVYWIVKFRIPISSENSLTWAIHIRQLSNRYSLKNSLLCLNRDPPPKSEYKELIETKIAINPATSVLVFPSLHADTQSLVSLMDTVTLAGSSKLRIIRLDGK